MAHQHQTIGFVTDKAPGRGYKLSKIISLDGGLQAEVIAYRTTLPEIMGIVHGMEEQLFGEAAWYAPGPIAPAFPEAPRMPQPEADAEVHEGMPNVVQNYSQEGGLLGRLMRNETARALVPALFLAGVWIMANMRIV